MIYTPSKLTTALALATFSCLLTACNGTMNKESTTHNSDVVSEPATPSANSSKYPSTYKGTASVTQGTANIITPSLYDCNGNGRSAPIGEIKSHDGKTWTVPADVNFNNDKFPFAHDLNNPCTGVSYANAELATQALSDDDVVEVDADGEVVTAYIFADNYFEMYVNGVPVAKDNVPFTQFNSNIVQFKVKAPFTIAMKLVDWEENSGIGSENNQGHAYHPGDGGMVAVFKNSAGKTIDITDSNWKAQTFYTAPIRDLSCVSEQGALRLSTNCSTEGLEEGANDYGLHWALPDDWYQPNFDDRLWANASVYSNDEIGVNNKSAYTDFADIFDDQSDNGTKDAQFIWSSNVVLDNEVVVRHTVDSLK